METYDVFISGETIDLCCPSEQAIYKDGWYDWFNDPKITKYLDHGTFPNTPGEQIKYLNQSLDTKSSILTLIRPKGTDYITGVVSLSEINFQQRQAGLGIVIANRSDKSKNSVLIGMEAMSRMTEHAFEVVGVDRINTGQVAALRQWQHWHTLLGYRFEGIGRRRFKKGYHIYDTIHGSCLLEDYLDLKDKRNGEFWPGAARMLELIKLLPKESFSLHMERVMNEEWEKYRNSICFV